MVSEAMLDAGEAAVRLRQGNGAPARLIAEAVWAAMWGASGTGRRLKETAAVCSARAELLSGVSIRSVRRRYALSGSVCQRLLAEVRSPAAGGGVAETTVEGS